MAATRSQRYCLRASLAAAVLLLFSVNPGAAADFKILYSFPGQPDGASPWALIPAPDGGFYGATTSGGSKCYRQFVCGTVFELAHDNGWTNTILFSPGGHKGASIGPVTPDKHGNLFGEGEGVDWGYVFRLHREPDGLWREKTLYTFTGGDDGYLYCVFGNGYANGCGLLIDEKTGTLYGSAAGGNPRGRCSDGQQYGCGLVFALVPKGDGAWKFRTIYNFNDTGGTNGGQPLGGLIEDANGALYGTTYADGPSKKCNCGTIFKLVPTRSGEWTFHLIHAFGNVPDGSTPASGLVRDPQGNLWGVTTSGGTYNWGTVYEISAKTVNVIHSFNADAKGFFPGTAPIFDSSGAVYGATEEGGSWAGYCYGNGGCGVVYKLTNSGGTWSETVLHTFECSDSAGPESLLLGEDGSLYGTTAAEFGCGNGTVFRVK